MRRPQMTWKLIPLPLTLVPTPLNVIAPLTNCDIAVTSLYKSNNGLLAKWWPTFLNESDTMWANVSKSIHGDAKSVILVRIGGNEIADNFVNDANVKTMMESVNARGFGNSTDTNGSPLAYRITREAYANIYGPTVVADNIRLGDTDLFAEVEKDFVVYGKKL
ncbi:urease isoform X1 [Tanacetum coccineum]